MGKSLDEKFKKLSKKRQAKIASRVAELKAEVMTMRDLRHAMDMTQKKLAKKLGINQDNVSRLEARSDVLLSTLQAYVHSLGGNLTLVAEFPKRPPVFLTGLTALEKQKSSKTRSKVSKAKA